MTQSVLQSTNLNRGAASVVGGIVIIIASNERV